MSQRLRMSPEGSDLDFQTGVRSRFSNGGQISIFKKSKIEICPPGFGNRKSRSDPFGLAGL